MEIQRRGLDGRAVFIWSHATGTGEKLRREAGDLAARIYEQAYRSALKRYGDPAKVGCPYVPAAKRDWHRAKGVRG